MKTQKTLTLLFALATSSFFALGQGDPTTADKTPTATDYIYQSCYDYTLEAGEKLPAYYADKNWDLFSEFLTYWDNQCPEAKYPFIFRILLEFENKTFSTENLETDDLRKLSQKLPYVESKPLTNLQIHWAFKLLSEGGHTEEEEFLLKGIQRSDIDFHDLLNLENKNTRLHKLYKKHMRSLKREPWRYFFIEYLFGAVVPNGPLETINNQYELGMAGGIEYHNFLFGAEASYSWNNTQSPIIIPQEGEVWTNDYAGITNFTGKVGYLIFQRREHLVDLNMGMGYRFLSLNRETQNGNFIGTGSFTGSLGLRYQAPIVTSGIYNKISFGAEVRYYFTDFSNNSGTNLNGDLLALRLTFGILNWHPPY